jgi:beta-lactamase class D
MKSLLAGWVLPWVMAWPAQAAPLPGLNTTLFVQHAESGRTLGVNAPDWDRATIPASTFKIPNSLIGLETGVITPTTVFKWDGVQRWLPDWNQDHQLASAFKVSCVPCYQDLARKVGLKRMRHWIDTLAYPGMDIQAGNLDEFWLRGRSAISPRQQVAFLTRLAQRQLPLSLATQDTVESIMAQEQTPQWQLFAKTGWEQGAVHRGWYVGYVRNGQGTWVFATRLEAPAPDEKIFGPLRKQITLDYLRAQGFIS